MLKQALFGHDLIVSILYTCHVNYVLKKVCFSVENFSDFLFPFMEEESYKELLINYPYVRENGTVECLVMEDAIQSIKSLGLLTWWSDTEMYIITPGLIKLYEKFIEHHLSEDQKTQINEISKMFCEKFS